MIGPLIRLDRSLFRLINGAWTCPLLDRLMPFVTDFHKISWARFGLIPAVLAFWIWKERRKALEVILVLALTAGATDLLAHRVIKPMVGRLRPPLSMANVVLRAPYGGRLSFPSNHAANMFAASEVLSAAYPSAAVVFYAAAVLVSYSRVYVGVHYPSDVVAGALLGLLTAWLGLFLARRRGLQAFDRDGSKTLE